MSEEKSPRARLQGNCNKSNCKHRIGIPEDSKRSIVFNWRRGSPPNSAYIIVMSTKPLSERSQALRERQRQAAEEGAIARAEYQANDVAVRENMARLRALRLAKEAVGAAEPLRKARGKPLRNTRRK